jgi:hypothetical protein
VSEANPGISPQRTRRVRGAADGLDEIWRDHPDAFESTHHRKISFRDDFIPFLVAIEIEFDQQNI